MAKKSSKKKATYNPISYIKAANPGTYTSAYTNQINAARNQLMNFKYDPMQDARYQALAQIYGARGNQAAQDTLGDAAALNGGYGTSYAVSAAQQARNQYNQELASLVPDLEQNAYERMANNYNLLMDADTTAYQRYRDQVADYQWGKGYDTDIYQYKVQQAGSGGGGGGGGGRRRSGGGGGYSSGGSTGSSGTDYYAKAQAELAKSNPVIKAAQTKGQSMTDYYNSIYGNKKKKTGGGSSRGSISTSKKASMTK